MAMLREKHRFGVCFFVSQEYMQSSYWHWQTVLRSCGVQSVKLQRELAAGVESSKTWEAIEVSSYAICTIIVKLLATITFVLWSIFFCNMRGSVSRVGVLENRGWR
jgi:hypothetical protein